jgi:hypothetical protein
MGMSSFAVPTIVPDVLGKDRLGYELRSTARLAELGIKP